MKQQIAIVGGGPGGLTLARLLQQGGMDVRVYERDLNRNVRQQGATLDLHEESGLEALRRAGLIEAFKEHYRPDAGKMRVVDAQMQLLIDDHAATQPVPESRPEIDRGPLREILLESLAPDTVQWDSQFERMEPSGRGWILYFKSGVTAYADLVIAADGAHSRLRKYITDIAPVYSGVTIVEGNVYDAEKHAPDLWELVKGGKVFALHGGKTLILSAKGDGTLSFYTGCKVPEDWVQASGIDFGDKAAVAKWFAQTYGDWDGRWQELFGSGECSIVPRPQYHYAPGQHWQTQDNVTMLGDAAHRMPPYAGEGVNMAMQDAYELAACLLDRSYATMQAALHAYEKGMLERAAKVTQDTLEQTEMMHSEAGLAHLVQLFSGQ